jgi:hypothetical protein
MRRFLGLLAMALGSAAATGAGPVEVVYVNPEAFAAQRDAMRPSPAVRDHYLAELRRYLERRAAERVADGETLVVRITDVQLAGIHDPLLHPPGASVRIVRDVTPARIDLGFALTRADGTVLREGRRELRGTGYPLDPRVDPSDPLRYEKALLDDWLAREFSRAGATAPGTPR